MPGLAHSCLVSLGPGHLGVMASLEEGGSLLLASLAYRSDFYFSCLLLLLLLLTLLLPQGCGLREQTENDPAPGQGLALGGRTLAVPGYFF